MSIPIEVGFYKDQDGCRWSLDEWGFFWDHDHTGKNPAGLDFLQIDDGDPLVAIIPGEFMARLGLPFSLTKDAA